MAEHITKLERVGDEWEWSCSCGEEATGFEDADSADEASWRHATAEGHAAANAARARRAE